MLTDTDEIKYYKATQRCEIIFNFMLGDYNNEGEYIIDDSVVDELVKMPKSVLNSFHNMIFCQSLVVTEFIEKEQFVVKTVVDENNPRIKISTLEVTEKVNKVEGYIVNTISTPIAQFVDVDSEQYYEKMFDAFNIHDASDFQQEEISKFTKGSVSLRRKYVVALNHLCNKKIMEVDKNAYLKKLEILKKSGKVGEVALKSFEERLKKNPHVAAQNNYKAMNELLDSVIETHKEQIEQIMPQLKQVGTEYAEKTENIEKFANQNLVNLQQSESGKNAIKTQQAIVAKNAVTKKQTVKNIVTQEAINSKYREKHAEQVILQEAEVNKEPKQEKMSFVKAMLGSIFPSKNTSKPEKKEFKAVKQDAKTQQSANENKQETQHVTSNKTKTEQATENINFQQQGKKNSSYGNQTEILGSKASRRNKNSINNKNSAKQVPEKKIEEKTVANITNKSTASNPTVNSVVPNNNNTKSNADKKVSHADVAEARYSYNNYGSDSYADNNINVFFENKNKSNNIIKSKDTQIEVSFTREQSKEPKENIKIQETLNGKEQYLGKETHKSAKEILQENNLSNVEDNIMQNFNKLVNDNEQQLAAGAINELFSQNYQAAQMNSFDEMANKSEKDALNNAMKEAQTIHKEIVRKNAGADKSKQMDEKEL